MTFSYWHKEAQGAPVQADVAIVGGGIVGCSTAWWLRRLAPERKVVLLEAGRLSAGASGRNAGFILQSTANDYLTDTNRFGADVARRRWQFASENRRLMEAELDGSAFGWEASGNIIVAGTPEEEERLRASVSPMRADGVSVVYLPSDEVARRLHARDFYGGLYVSTGGMVNSFRLVRHLAEESGVEVREHHRVTNVSAHSDGVELAAAQNDVKADRVVLAVNAWLPKLVPTLGRFIRPVRAQMLATAPTPQRRIKLPVYSHKGYFYLRQLANGTLLLGGARHKHREEEIGYADITTPAVQADLERYLYHHFPWTQGLAIERRWSGTMGFSPDGLPAVGALPGIPGAFWVGGFTGHGMSCGFNVGRLLAERLVRDEAPGDWALFSAERFARSASGAQAH